MSDCQHLREHCQHLREHLSADLDGEAGPGGASTLDAAYRHLASCPGCTRWFAEATRINRLVRTAPAEPGPGFTATQLDGLLDLLPEPARTGPSPAQRLLRAALAAVGIAQVTLGIWSLWVPLDPHTGMAGAGMVHMSHEYAAWSIALGISFLAGAVWTRHLVGALPMLASFVGVLLAVSAVDLINDSVELERVVSHGLIVLGLGLVVAIVLTQREPSPSQGPDRVSQDTPDPVSAPPHPTDEPVSHDGTSQPAARHRAA